MTPYGGASRSSGAAVAVLLTLGALASGCVAPTAPPPIETPSETLPVNEPPDLSWIRPSYQSPPPSWPESVAPRRRSLSLSFIQDLLGEGAAAEHARRRLEADPFGATWAAVTTMYDLDPLDGEECRQIGLLNEDLIGWTGALPLQTPDVSETALVVAPEVAVEHLRVVMLWLRWLESDLLRDERLFVRYVARNRSRNRGR